MFSFSAFAVCSTTRSNCVETQIQCRLLSLKQRIIYQLNCKTVYDLHVRTASMISIPDVYEKAMKEPHTAAQQATADTSNSNTQATSRTFDGNGYISLYISCRICAASSIFTNSEAGTIWRKKLLPSFGKSTLLTLWVI